MGEIFEALLAMIGLGVLVLAAWAAMFTDRGTAGRELRDVRRTAEDAMRRAAEQLRRRDW